MADLKQSGTMPVVREVFMILVMTRTRASRYCLVREVGIGSRLQLFEAVFIDTETYNPDVRPITLMSLSIQVQTGQVDMAIGGDQGGSIRIPASYTGIVGLKPTFGLVPYTGATGHDPTVDHLGPMAKTVTDCALLLEVQSS